LLAGWLSPVKAALNARQFAALREQHAAGARTGPEQDAPTLFDEGGVIVASSDDEFWPAAGMAVERTVLDHRARLQARARFHAVRARAL
jgi:hypothetical protein